MGKARLSSDQEFGIIQLLPNLITIGALTAGLTAIRFATQERYDLAVLLIVLAAVLDGIDGRIARLLKCEGMLGAELDSLSDFVNFGVAAPLVVYLWALEDMRSAGWLAVLVYAVCCVLRLARFNVTSRTRNNGKSRDFAGIPAPAGALLAMWPLYVSFLSANASVLPAGLVAGNLVAIGLLMISRIPTPSLTRIRVAGRNVKFVIVGVAFLGAAVLTYPWMTLIAICLAYVGWVVADLVRRRGNECDHVTNK